MINKESFSVEIELVDNKLSIYVNEPEAVEYGFYIYHNDSIIEMVSFSDTKKFSYWLSESGTYHVKAYARDAKDNRVSKWSEKVEFDIEQTFVIEEKPIAKKSVFSHIKEVMNDLVNNRAMLLRMAISDYKLENKDTYLGRVWAVLTPLIQIGTYWFVFGIGLRSGRAIDGFPYLAWMLLGLVPWFFMNGCITKGANSIYSKASLLAKLQFCIVTVPVSKIIQEMYEFIIMLAIMLIGLLGLGIYPTVYWFNIIYYIIYAVVFLVCLSLITSVLTVVVRDFYKLLTSLMRLLFYLTPILWQMDDMPAFYQKAMYYSPIYYVVSGFRESVLYNIPFYKDAKLLLIMWLVNIVLFASGCVLQSRFKNKFIDLI